MLRTAPGTACGGGDSKVEHHHCNDSSGLTWMECGARIDAALARMTRPVSPSLDSVSGYRFVEVVRAVIHWLVGSLSVECPSLHV
jgi:hypothetical protein